MSFIRYVFHTIAAGRRPKQTYFALRSSWTSCERLLPHLWETPLKRCPWSTRWTLLCAHTCCLSAGWRGSGEQRRCFVTDSMFRLQQEMWSPVWEWTSEGFYWDMLYWDVLTVFFQLAQQQLNLPSTVNKFCFPVVTIFFLSPQLLCILFFACVVGSKTLTIDIVITARLTYWKES